MTMTEAEKIAADRIARAIEKGTGYNMHSSARMAQAAIGYIQGVGLEIRTSNPWQPIETAPKDGTTVMLWLPDSRDDHLVFAAWDDPDWWQQEHSGGFIIDVPATHWMPLPGPPP